MTPSKTAFAGLEALGPGDPLSSDGYYFQSRNPFLTDRLLRLGATTHRHDAHAALTDPTLPPTATVAGPGGSIPSSTAISVVYTLTDADGGETLPVAVVAVSTPPTFLSPTTPPVCAVDHTAGGLLAATLAYAVTVTDGAGGETVIGPAGIAVVSPGYANSEVAISGLTAITTTASGGAIGAGWRLWRSQGGGPWYLIGSGTMATDGFTDGGTAGDCTVAPPSVTTVAGNYGLSVTVPGGQPSGTVTYNIYGCTDGQFTNPCLLGAFPISSAGTVQVFGDILGLPGAPPAVSTCYGGATQIDPDTEMLNMMWRRPVANHAALPSTGNNDGDMREALDTHRVWVWDASEPDWSRSPWLPPVASAGALPVTDLVDGDACMALDTHRVWWYDATAVAWKRTHWLEAVASFATLPVADLEDGDQCITLDTHHVWHYDGSAWTRELRWLPSVANSAALPTTNLFDADICMTRDTREIWVYYAGSSSWARYRPHAIILRAHTNAGTIPNVALGAAAKLAVGTVDTDTDSWWDATNTRYIPGRAGWYRVRGFLQTGTTTTAPSELAVAKNNTPLPDAITRVAAAASGGTQETSVLVPMNGTGDYLELYAGVNQAAVNVGTAALSVHYVGD